jgi:hypothetical protein
MGMRGRSPFCHYNKTIWCTTTVNKTKHVEKNVLIRLQNQYECALLCTEQ